MRVQDDKQLTAVLVQDIPDIRRSNVWLRKNIVEGTGEDGNVKWDADELFVEVTYKENLQEEIVANFEYWWGFLSQPQDEQLPIEKRIELVEEKTVTLEEAIDAIFGGV